MKKRLLSLIICFALILPAAFILTACGKAKPKSMSVSGAQTEFLYQDDFVFGEDAEVKIKMSKGDALKFDADDLTYDAEEKIAETDDYKVDYSEYDANVLGEYEIKVIYKADSSITYSYEVTVSARPFADADVTANEYTGVYDGEAHSISVECAVEGATITYSTDGVTYTDTNPTYEDVGTYTVYFTVDKENYAPPVSGTKNVVIEKKEVSLNWGSASFVYNKNEQIPTCTLSGVVEGDTCNVTVTGGATDAGNHTATATALSNSNYKLPEEVTKTFVISPKKVNKPVLATATEFVYNAGEQEIEFEAAFEEGVGAIGVNAATNAGRYTYSVKLQSANYIWNDDTTAAIDINWEIKKKGVSVPVVVGEFTYKAVPQTVSITGFNADVMTKEGTEKSTNAGSFTLRFNLKDTLNYYWVGDNISVVAGEKTKIWTIAKATADTQNMVWDYTAPFTYDGNAKTVSLEGVPSGFEPIYEGCTNTNAGNNYLATVTFTYDAQNYNAISIEPLYWTILKATPSYVTPTGLEATKAEGLTLASVSLASFTGFEWLVPTTAVNASGYYTAKFTPADTANYTILENVQVYINVIDPAKAEFTSYVFDGSNFDTSKDLAIQVTEGVWNFSTTYGVEVKVDDGFTTGNAADATITYNGQASFVVQKPGVYNVLIKVTKEGYNDFVTYQTVTVDKAEPQVWNTPEVTSKERITIDDTLAIVEILGGTVCNTSGEPVEGSWSWKEPNTQLELGDNVCIAVFTPTEADIYSTIEQEFYVYANRGLPIRTFKVGETTYTTGKDEYDVEVEVYVPYGESVTIDFSSIKDGFKIFNSEWEEYDANIFVVESQDITFSSQISFIFGEEQYNHAQQITIYLVEETYLEEFEVRYKNDSATVEKLDLLKYSTGNIQGEVVYISLEAQEGYTATAYVNDIAVGTDITANELVLGTNKVVIVVKDGEGNAVRYITRSFNYSLPESYEIPEVLGDEKETFAMVVGQGAKETIVVNTMETPSITLSTVLDTDRYNVVAYKMNNANGSYSVIALNEPITLAAGANVFKVVLTINGAAKVVKEIVVYDASADFGASYDETFETEDEYYSISVNYSSYWLSYVETIDIDAPIDIDEDIEIYHNSADKNGTISNLINDYYLIRIISDTEDLLYKVVRINKWYIEDNQTSVKFYLVVNDVITEIEDLEETIEMQILQDGIYVKPVNPAAVISVDHSMLYLEYGVISAMMAFDAQDVEIAVTSSDGSKTDKKVVNVQANAIKVFGITPIKTVETEEVKGTELVANMSGFMMFTGDININVSESMMEPSTAMAVDLISNYTFYNADGEVWAEGDGAKHIKIDIFAQDCMVAKGFDFEEGEPIEPYDSLEGILLEVQETADGYRAHMCIIADSFGIINATMELVEEFTETQIKLSVKDAQGTELQDFEINLKAVNGSAVLGDYFMANQGLEYCVGSFVGDSTEYYVDDYTGNIYSYTDGVIGTTILGTLTDYEGYILASKTEGELEGIEIGTEFVFQGEDVLGLTYLLAPNDELKAALATLGAGTLSISVEVTEGVKALNMQDALVKPIYTEITGDISSFNNMGMQCFGLKLVYNEGEANEFEIILQGAFASLEDIMGAGE